ncbi:unnamed protein product [Linum trigynum]|uniref:Uncharacterized protein n=1 Tax=Linum trigynum TaxID=586398 RepID=A0AAV2F0K0_9ROSI
MVGSRLRDWRRAGWLVGDEPRQRGGCLLFQEMRREEKGFQFCWSIGTTKKKNNNNNNAGAVARGGRWMMGVCIVFVKG